VKELVRIKEYVSPRLEISEITDRISKTKGGGKALLFENSGYDFPVLMNAYGRERKMCLALGVNHLDDVAKEIESLFHLLAFPKENIIDKLKLLPKLNQFASWMPKVRACRGECQQVVLNEPDIRNAGNVTTARHLSKLEVRSLISLLQNLTKLLQLILHFWQKKFLF
jgi:4-hydroxy-3-polyprenylbenzoate decarboxylase